MFKWKFHVSPTYFHFTVNATFLTFHFGTSLLNQRSFYKTWIECVMRRLLKLNLFTHFFFFPSLSSSLFIFVLVFVQFYDTREAMLFYVWFFVCVCFTLADIRTTVSTIVLRNWNELLFICTQEKNKNTRVKKPHATNTYKTQFYMYFCSHFSSHILLFLLRDARLR